MTTWLKGARDAGTAAGWIRVMIPLADDVRADDQENAKRDEQQKGDHHVPGGGFIVLIRVHVMVPLRDFIK
jgi:hypothetical protein